MRRMTDYGPSLVVLATAAVVLVLGPMIVRDLAFIRTEQQIIRARAVLDQSTVLEELNHAQLAIAEAVAPSVVHINALMNESERSLSTGSGWVYDADGHIVTNHHVVANAQRIQVQLAGQDSHVARIIGADPATDIAVIKVDTDRVHPAERGDSRDVQQGQVVFAFGSPFDFPFSMSQGIVSGKGRHVGVIKDQAGNPGYESFIQVDAAINPGNSGGPLTDHAGRVIGMNTAIATGQRRRQLDEGQFAGIGLAIPLEMIEPVVDQIIEKGFVAKGFLGVEVDDLEAGDLTFLDFRGEGAIIRRVREGTPAFLGGLRQHDIVVSVNDQSVSGEEQLKSVISSLRPGETAAIRAWRYDHNAGAGEMIRLSVTVARLQTLATRGVLPPDHPADHLRELDIASMRTATRELCAEKRIPFQRGVIIEALVRGSRLARSVPPDSIIVSVNDTLVTSTRELLDELARHNLRIIYPTLGRPFGGVRAEIVMPRGGRGVITLGVG